MNVLFGAEVLSKAKRDSATIVMNAFVPDQALKRQQLLAAKQGKAASQVLAWIWQSRTGPRGDVDKVGTLHMAGFATLRCSPSKQESRCWPSCTYVCEGAAAGGLDKLP